MLQQRFELAATAQHDKAGRLRFLDEIAAVGSPRTFARNRIGVQEAVMGDHARSTRRSIGWQCRAFPTAQQYDRLAVLQLGPPEDHLVEDLRALFTVGDLGERRAGTRLSEVAVVDDADRIAFVSASRMMLPR